MLLAVDSRDISHHSLSLHAHSLPPFAPSTAYRQLKRLPRQPKAAFTVAAETESIQTIQPIPFVDLV